MPARSHAVIAILLVIVVACSPVGGAGSSAPIGSSTASAGPSLPAATPTPSPHPTPTPAPTPRATANPDGSVTITMPAQFGWGVPGDASVWGIVQYGTESRAIVRVDLETYEIRPVVRDLPVADHPINGVVANGSFWLVSRDKTVTQYDASTGELIREIEVGLFPIEPVVAYGDVWTIDHNGDSVTRIDSETGEATSIALPGSHPLTITVVADDLMLVNGPEGDPTTTWMVDPPRMKLIGTFESTGCFKQYGWIGTAIEGRVWRRYCGTDEVTIADPRTGKILDSFHSPACPYPPLYVDGAMWMPTGPEPCSDWSRGLVALDPETREVLGTYELPADIRVGGWWFAAFDSWWYFDAEGLVRVPADTLRAAMTR